MGRTDFRFYLGATALNFSATLGFRASTPLERMPDREALGRWLSQAGLASGTVPAASEYRAAIELREAIFAVAEAVVEQRRPAAAAVETINASARRAPAVPQLDPATLNERVEAPAPVRAALGQIARDAIDVFAHRRADLRRCEDATCRAILLPQRGSTRRWCSMATCGNRAKVAAYRARRGS